MALGLNFERTKHRPIYQQIAEQIKSRIADGRLPGGTRLPTVRELASDLGVTRLTIQNSYSELQNGGWVEATVGRGTFVAEIRASQVHLPSMNALTPDEVLAEMMRLSQSHGFRSLGMAHPDPALMPSDEFWSHLVRLRPHAAEYLSYGGPMGDPSLRVQLADFARERGIHSTPDEILVTSGVSQGLSLAVQAVTEPGDAILVEQPTYCGILNLLNSLRVRPIGIPIDKEGPDLEAVEREARANNAKVFYTIPSSQNPTGFTSSAERRSDLIALARKLNMTIIEDDIYSRLQYNSQTPNALRSLDQDNVIYLDGFSKTLLPGIRIGFAIANSKLIHRMTSLRRAADLSGLPFVQKALSEFLRDGEMKRHLKRVVPKYAERRDVLIKTLERSMPKSVTWTAPTGGFTTWLTIPWHSSLADLYHAAVRRGIGFAPGEAFLASSTGDYHLRLAFGSQKPEVIREIVPILAEMISSRLERPDGAKLAQDWVNLV